MTDKSSKKYINTENENYLKKQKSITRQKSSIRYTIFRHIFFITFVVYLPIPMCSIKVDYKLEKHA